MLQTLASGEDLQSVDLIVRVLELLAGARDGLGVTDVARALGVSKARAYRHLRALVRRGYAAQDPRTEDYEIGVKVLALGEQVRDRFDIARIARPIMSRLREASGLAVTASALIEGKVTVVEMLQGRTLVEFAIRPGAQLDFHASAHGLVALAFGPPALAGEALRGPLKAWTGRTVTEPGEIRDVVERVRSQGWATAEDAVQIGVNALAAPVFDHRGDWRGALALVGASQFLPAVPSDRQVVLVTAAAAEASRALGWEGP